MKKLLLLPIVCFSFTLQAQTVLNGGFENWNSTPYDDPDMWYGPNMQYMLQYGTPVITKVTGFSNSAVRIETKIISQDTLQAYISNTPGDPTNGVGGVPYSQKPTAISGYYRYSLGSTDTALFLVIFKKAGAVINTDLYPIRGTGSQLSWTAFSFNLTLSQTPDTVIIAAASSNLINNVGILNGSFLELDQLLFTGTGITQQVPNNGFDNWTTKQIDIPNAWDISGMGITKTPSAYSGSYAVRMENFSDGGSGNNVWPSGITSGYYTSNGSKGGRPYTNTTDTLTGYYKYTTTGSDSGAVYIDVRKNGSSIGGAYSLFPPKATYTYFSIKIGPFSNPDSIRIDFASKNWPFTNATVGSALYIDNLQLKSSPLGLFGPADPYGLSNSYPNPAADFLRIALKVNLSGDLSMNVFDASGRNVMNRHLENPGALFEVPVQELSPGIYFYELRNGDTVIRNKFVKQ